MKWELMLILTGYWENKMSIIQHAASALRWFPLYSYLIVSHSLQPARITSPPAVCPMF